VRTTHLSLDLRLDFEQHVLSGTATFDLNWLDDSCAELVLDTHGLQIEQISTLPENASTLPENAQWEEAGFSLGDADPATGSRLTIATPHQPARVRVRYQTSPRARGLQWLDAGQTADGRLPFMFSQSQAIHARSWVPVQDTPAIRFTYDATVACPPELTVLMSADNVDALAGHADTAPDRHAGRYRAQMTQPIPSYLLAIAAGDLAFAPLSDRYGVWAEPSVLARAAAEFADTEAMMVAAEQAFGPYRWGRYDILVLPPSFPHGGMENPRMTFATPTVIVGDKSLTSLVAHELAHSWSGNLVTQDSWDDVWLNEGFTSYVENRLVEAVYGPQLAEMETVIKQRSVLAAVERFDAARVAVELPPLNHHGEYHGTEGLGYLKGCWFLHWLQSRFGTERFDRFLTAYFDHFAFHSICTDDFAAFAAEHLLSRHPDVVTVEEWSAWLDAPGIPSFAEPAESARLTAVELACDRWLHTHQLPDTGLTNGWITQEWLRFLESMPEGLPAGRLADLDLAYHFTGTANGEIARRWYVLAAKAGYEPARAAMAAFLTEVGRMKLIIPVYQALAATDDGRAFARDVYSAAKPGYHPITAERVATSLGLDRAG
jgi:aminopeptidase N